MEISVKEKTLSITVAIVASIIFISLLSVACSPQPSPASNTEGIRVGDCVEHVISPEIRGVVLRTANSTVTARSADAQTRRIWEYTEIRKIQCPRGN